MSELEDDLIEQAQRGLLYRHGIPIETDPVKYKEQSVEKRKAELNKAFAELQKKREAE